MINSKKYRCSPLLHCLLGVFLITGCRPLKPYIAPNFEVPSDWKEAVSNSQEIKNSDLDWWKHFNDPLLTELEEEALSNNSDLNSMSWSVAQAWARVSASAAPLYPNLSFAPNTSNQIQLMSPFYSAPTGVSGHNSSLYQRYKTTQYNTPFVASYEFDLWGKFRYGVEMTFASAEAQQEAFKTAQITLTSSVAMSYFTIRMLDAEEQVLNQTIKVRQEALEINQIRFNAGLVTYADVSRAETELWIAKADLSETYRLRANQEHHLAVLVGGYPACFCMERSPLIEVSPKIAAITPSEVLRNRPDLIQSERELASFYANEGAVLAAIFPSLAISAQAGFSSPVVSNLLDWKARFFSLAWEGFQTIFDAGKKEADVAIAHAQLEQSLNDYAQNILTAFKEVEDALTSIKWQKETLEQLRKAEESSSISTALAIERYNKGLVTYLEVVDAERIQLETQLRTVQVLGNTYLSTIALVKATGGYWVEEME
jgi:outer membrane protein, multidrug efflux system